MKELIKQYGTLIVSCLCAFFVISLIFYLVFASGTNGASTLKDMFGMLIQSSGGTLTPMT